jgi:hypothetical protein
LSNLSGFDEAPVFNRLPSFELGSYVVEVLSFRKFFSESKPGDYFASEFRIVEASPGSGNKPGDEVADVLPLHGPFKATFYGKTKQIIASATGEKSGQIKLSDLEEATSTDNPCKGAKMRVFVSKAKKKNGEEYNRPAYSPFETSPAAP